MRGKHIKFALISEDYSFLELNWHINVFISILFSINFCIPFLFHGNPSLKKISYTDTSICNSLLNTDVILVSDIFKIFDLINISNIYILCSLCCKYSKLCYMKQ